MNLRYSTGCQVVRRAFGGRQRRVQGCPAPTSPRRVDDSAGTAMTDRRLLLFGLAVILVLSGCTGGLGPNNADTPTPEAVVT